MDQRAAKRTAAGLVAALARAVDTSPTGFPLARGVDRARLRRAFDELADELERRAGQPAAEQPDDQPPLPLDFGLPSNDHEACS